MRNYTDIHINVSAIIDDPKKSIDKLRQLGYKSIAIAYFDLEPHLKLKDTLMELNFDVASRIQFKPKTKVELLKMLRNYRSKFEVVGVKCINMEVARTAARDTRVDIISFPRDNYRVRLSEKLAGICNAAVEINVNELIKARQQKYILLQKLRNEINCAISNGLNLIITSGATGSLELISPRDLASIPAVMGIGTQECLKSVSENPYSIICKNRTKLKGGFIS